MKNHSAAIEVFIVVKTFAAASAATVISRFGSGLIWSRKRRPLFALLFLSLPSLPRKCYCVFKHVNRRGSLLQQPIVSSKPTRCFSNEKSFSVLSHVIYYFIKIYDTTRENKRSLGSRRVYFVPRSSPPSCEYRTRSQAVC